MRGIRLGFVAGTAGLLLAAGTPAALAGGNGAQTFTQHDRNVNQVMTENANPCTGDLGTLTLHFSDVFHGTINKTGSWFTGTIHGTLSFVPDDATKPSYTGHFTTWFGDENNQKNEVEHSTFSVHSVGSDGSHLSFHETSHAGTNANGTVTVSFDKMRCG